MIFISHRGNLEGPDPKTENTEHQISYAIEQGFDVEVDVWLVNGELFLGHDSPLHPTSLEFLGKSSIWAHAKNFDAFVFLLENNIHCFWHENDERTLTSKGIVWTYPNKDTCSKSVLVVLTDKLNLKYKNLYGVCGDHVLIWKIENEQQSK